MLEKAIQVLKKINKLDKKAFIVGGFVRDYLLNIESFDIDICTNLLPDDIKKTFSRFKDYNSKYGNIIIYYRKERFEITTFRKENNYLDKRHPNDIVFIDDEYIDSLRRDFTINALLMDKNKKIFDFHNGLNDLNNKIIRTINDPNIRFEEDPIRILRGIYLVSRLNFNLEEETYNACINKSFLLKDIKFERLYYELNKIFIQKHLNKAINLIKTFNIPNYLNLNNSFSLLDDSFSFDEVLILESFFNFDYIINLPLRKALKLKIKLYKEFDYNNIIDLFNINLDDLKLYIKLMKYYNNSNLEYLIFEKNNFIIHNIKELDININDLKEYNTNIKNLLNDILIKVLNKELINDEKEIKTYLEMVLNDKRNNS